MARYRNHSIEFKRQVVQEYLAGDVSLHGLAKRHRICRNLIRLWLTRYEAGELNEEAPLMAGSPAGAKCPLAARSLPFPRGDTRLRWNR